MRLIKVEFDNGDSLTTSINGTDDEIRRYYVGNRFNLGSGENDCMATAVSVMFLESATIRWHSDGKQATVPADDIRKFVALYGKPTRFDCEFDDSYRYDNTGGDGPYNDDPAVYDGAF